MAPKRRGATAQAFAGRGIVLLLLLCALIATLRGSVGSGVPWPQARPLRIFDSSAPASAAFATPSRWAKARLAGDERAWGETFCALPALLGEWASRVAPREWGSEVAMGGALRAIFAAWMLIVAWWLAARIAGWRRPSRGLGLLLLSQGFGACLWLGAARAPVRRVEPASTCRAFDFGARTIGSGGLLSPQASINWHRARGFSGLAFVDASLSQRGIEMLRASNPDMILLGGFEQDGVRRVLGPGSSLRIKMLAQTPANAAVEATDAIEAWSGSVGDDALAQQSRARGVPAVGSSGGASECRVWALLPADARTPEAVIAAVKSRRVAVALALLPDETPARGEARRGAAGGAGAIWKSGAESMSKLSRAQKLNAWAQVLALGLAALCWGASAAKKDSAPEGPLTVMKFLRRKRLLRRVLGLAVMLASVAGTAWIGALVLGASAAWKSALPPNWMMPLALGAWLLLDAAYLSGRGAWRRAH